jgi:hypothetical protein
MEKLVRHFQVINPLLVASDHLDMGLQGALLVTKLLTRLHLSGAGVKF